MLETENQINENSIELLKVTQLCEPKCFTSKNNITIVYECNQENEIGIQNAFNILFQETFKRISNLEKHESK